MGLVGLCEFGAGAGCGDGGERWWIDTWVYVVVVGVVMQQLSKILL